MCSLSSESIGYNKPRDYVQRPRPSTSLNPASTAPPRDSPGRTAHNSELSRIREVHDPELVRALSVKATLHVIWRPCRGLVRFGRDELLASPGTSTIEIQFMPRCDGECGSAKKTGMPISTVNCACEESSLDSGDRRNDLIYAPSSKAAPASSS